MVKLSLLHTSRSSPTPSTLRPLGSLPSKPTLYLCSLPPILVCAGLSVLSMACGHSPHQSPTPPASPSLSLSALESKASQLFPHQESVLIEHGDEDEEEEEEGAEDDNDDDEAGEEGEEGRGGGCGIDVPIEHTSVALNGRQRLQHHWIQVGGNVIIPETWSREHQLKDWVSAGLVEDALRPPGLMTARSALVKEQRLQGTAGKAAARPSSSKAKQHRCCRV